ncbi:very short patch repair endonuclease [Bradyrhizobium barranii]
MSRIRSKNTKPELAVRSMAHRMGYRFRLHRRDLPGTPDLVFASKRKVIFVHGCFWHGHGCKRGGSGPKSNGEFWSAKITRNRERDMRVRRELEAEGWKSLVIWECEVFAFYSLPAKLRRFLG